MNKDNFCNYDMRRISYEQEVFLSMRGAELEEVWSPEIPPQLKTVQSLGLMRTKQPRKKLNNKIFILARGRT